MSFSTHVPRPKIIAQSVLHCPLLTWELCMGCFALGIVLLFPSTPHFTTIPFSVVFFLFGGVLFPLCSSCKAKEPLDKRWLEHIGFDSIIDPQISPGCWAALLAVYLAVVSLRNKLLPKEQSPSWVADGDEEESRGQKDANDLRCLCSIHLIRAVLVGNVSSSLLQAFPQRSPRFWLVGECFVLF